MARPKGVKNKVKVGDQTPNDQGELIQNLRDGKFIEVWEAVKFIGVSHIKNINKRMKIFFKAVDRFDPYVNNNFIMFYNDYLRRSNDGQGTYTFTVTNNGQIINTLKNEAVSPNEDGLSQFVQNIKDFEKI